MKSPICNLKKIKAYIGSVIVFSCILQSISPLMAAGHTYKPLPQKQEQTSSPKAHNFIQDHNLNKLIRYIAEGPDAHIFNKNLSDPLKRCYKTLLKGTQVLPIEDVWQAMPDILQYVVDYHTKAPRPNAPITESNAIVGPGACDTAQLLELLVIIKNRIGCVTDDVCCNTILGILGNACEIFGPDDSISSILIEILNLIQTQTLCCEFPQTWTILAAIEQDIQDTFTVLEELQETLEECCEAIRADIFDTLTILSEEISNISTPPCAPTPITGPITITESGPYCLAQDINGTIVIAASNVSIDLNSHQITATSPGIEIQSGLYNITIFNGTITGTVGSTGIEASDSTDIEINDINFIIDSVGITFNNIQNFIINNTQFTNYTNSAMSFTNSQNGRITNSQIQANNNTALIPTLLLITMNGCQQLVFNNIIMTNNTNIQAFRGMSGINTHECTFENIQITSNETIQTLEGLHLENCDNNSIRQYIVNKNSISSTLDTSLVGITITASTDGSGKNNSITECQVHDNVNSISPGAGSAATIVGVNIAGIINSGTVSSFACANTTISNTSIVSNACNTINRASSIVGIHMASILNNGSIGTDACANCTITNCTITRNINNCIPQDGDIALFVGINLAGIFGDTGSTATIGVNTCRNCHITACNVSDNDCSASAATLSSVLFAGINLAGTYSLSLVPGNKVVDNDACANCSVNYCLLNNNRCISVSGITAPAHTFVGINLSSTLGGSTINSNGCRSCSIKNNTINNNTLTTSGPVIFIGCNLAETLGGVLGTNACESCVIANCTVNNNINTSTNNSASFIGINCGESTGSATSAGNNCNNCKFENIRIYQNIRTNNGILGGFFAGFALNGIPRTFPGGCNNITCNSCLIEANTILGNGEFNGFLILGNGNNALAAGCNNIILTACEVNHNSAVGASDTAYHIEGIDDTGIGGANNIQFNSCMAKQNTSSGSCNGFLGIDLNNAIWLTCASIANSTDGFRVQGTVDSSLRNCKAFGNGDNGFIFSGPTQNVTIIDSQALGNLDDGFNFAVTTTLCHISNNIAQNNDTGFNNGTGDINAHQFFGNFAQGNATNYIDVDIVTITPDLATGSFANVST